MRWKVLSADSCLVGCKQSNYWFDR